MICANDLWARHINIYSLHESNPCTPPSHHVLEHAIRNKVYKCRKDIHLCFYGCLKFVRNSGNVPVRNIN